MGSYILANTTGGQNQVRRIPDYVHSQIRSADTYCERVLRSRLFHCGYRFRKNVRTLPGRPDIVFVSKRIAIFCDGNFWHGKDWKDRKQKLSKGANASYWILKIEANMSRDKRVNRELQSRGWKVLRYWESDIINNVESIVSLIEATL